MLAILRHGNSHARVSSNPCKERRYGTELWCILCTGRRGGTGGTSIGYEWRSYGYHPDHFNSSGHLARYPMVRCPGVRTFDRWRFQIPRDAKGRPILHPHPLRKATYLYACRLQSRTGKHPPPNERMVSPVLLVPPVPPLWSGELKGRDRRH